MAAQSDWRGLAQACLGGESLSRVDATRILEAPEGDLLSLLDAAFSIREHYHGRRVHLHVLDNAKLGACPEDCGFCSQSAPNGSPGGEAPIKSVDELVRAAHDASRLGAKRYCMVTATRGPSQRDLDVICEAATQIKSELNIELCASLGLLTEAKASRLASSGVDRFNHNLETSQRYFDQIVTTHSWSDRVNTIKLAKQAGMETCVGGIVGLGENLDDTIDLALSLRELDVDSLPVNFLDPRPGTPLAEMKKLSPTQALRALCMFRFAHPRTDLRVAGGRETVLRSVQGMALYPANSIFTSGYLTTGGNLPAQDLQMIEDMGFEIEHATRRKADAPVRLPVAQ